DVRVVASTHVDLEAAVAEGLFREDLYYRLNVVTVEIPPLRERAMDIGPLINHFINEYSRIHGKSVAGISNDALRILSRYAWPGNVRELKNAVENMVVSSQSEVLGVEDIPRHIHAVEERVSTGGGIPVGTTIRDMERILIQATLEHVGGNRRDAAAMLGIGERTLYRKIKEYGLSG
ncbi:MAG: sigma-54-dependent Fis family transcriptional regulator, partial [Planctomycetes bacterium]|nr:sigma-54-dependent Fis family transcriptional regulator [Planctomycetota bacterium]